MDDFVKIVSLLLQHNLPISLVYFAFFMKFVLLPVWKRLDGLSRYIKRYLVIARQHARSQDRVAGALEGIVRELERGKL